MQENITLMEKNIREIAEELMRWHGLNEEKIMWNYENWIVNQNVNDNFIEGSSRIKYYNKANKLYGFYQTKKEVHNLLLCLSSLNPKIAYEFVEIL